MVSPWKLWQHYRHHWWWTEMGTATKEHTLLSSIRLHKLPCTRQTTRIRGTLSYGYIFYTVVLFISLLIGALSPQCKESNPKAWIASLEDWIFANFYFLTSCIEAKEILGYRRSFLMPLEREKNVTKPEMTWVIIFNLFWPTTRAAATIASLAHMLMPVLWAA